MLHQLNKELGQTIIMITHNPEAATYSDRVVHMRDGVIVDSMPADSHSNTLVSQTAGGRHDIR